MLTKIDLKNIDNLLKKRITEALIDFYEKILLPHLDRNDQEHAKMIKENREEHEEIKQQLGEYIKNHEKRITKLERVTSIS